METRHIIRVAIAASVIGHLGLVAGVFMPEARPLEPHEDSVAVDLVTPQDLAEAEKKAEPEKKPEPDKPDFHLPDLSKPTTDQPAQEAAAAKPPAAQQNPPAPKPAPQSPPTPKPQQAPQPQQQSPPQQQAALQPAPPPMPQAPMPQPAPSPSLQAPAPQPAPAAAVPASPPQPDPDLTVKYGVMLGLPSFGGATAAEQADVPKSDIEAFHRHLRNCLKLPATVARNDDAMVKLRALLSPDGRLIAEPTVIEVRRPAKAALLLQAAKAALEACQPYSMLPADKYDEWKVLDLPFTPQDFAS